MYNDSASWSKASRPTHAYIQQQQSIAQSNMAQSRSMAQSSMAQSSMAQSSMGGYGQATQERARSSRRSEVSQVATGHWAAADSQDSICIDIPGWKKAAEPETAKKVEKVEDAKVATADESSVEIIVKYNGAAFMVSIPISTTIRGLKEKIITMHSELKMDQFRIVVAEKAVEDESKTLEALNVAKEDIVHILAYDAFGNEAGNDFDLGQDGAFGDYSVLFGCFYSECQTAFRANCGAALQKKGFHVRSYGSRQEDAFTSELKTGKYDVAVVVSDSQFGGSNQAGFTEELLKHYRQGKGLMIFGDNVPYFVHANLLLPTIAGCQLEGNDPGEQLLMYGNPKTKGQFDQTHHLFVGVNSLYEGHTICVPTNTSKLNVVATNSSNHPCILTKDSVATPQGKTGRLVLDMGFTKLYMQWTSAGQSRYIVNSIVWLIDLEARGKA